MTPRASAAVGVKVACLPVPSSTALPATAVPTLSLTVKTSEPAATCLEKVAVAIVEVGRLEAVLAGV